MPRQTTKKSQYRNWRKRKAFKLCTLAGGKRSAPGAVEGAGADNEAPVLHQVAGLAGIRHVLADGEVLADPQAAGRYTRIPTADHY